MRESERERGRERQIQRQRERERERERERGGQKERTMQCFMNKEDKSLIDVENDETTGERYCQTFDVPCPGPLEFVSHCWCLA